VHRERLDVIALSDFTLRTDVWLVQPEYKGNLSRAVNVFGRAVAARFSEAPTGGKVKVAQKRG
jgi:hypothetical protein